MSSYIFRSERLGFRNWTDQDLPHFTAMNADRKVMAHFPDTLTAGESAEMMERLRVHFDQKSYTYYAVELLGTSEWIGFIGLALQDYEAEFNPSTDIGWRLKRPAWGKGYATEGARRCLEYAFAELGLARVVSVCPVTNEPSQNVMRKAGMAYRGTFDHPKLKAVPALERCVWYEIVKGDQGRSAG